MSASELTVPNNSNLYCIDLNAINATITNLTVVNENVLQKSYVSKNWDLSTNDSVTLNGNGILSIQLNTTALTAGGNSAILTINNSAISGSPNFSLILVSVVSYSGIPPVFNNAITFYGFPFPLIAAIRDGSFDLLIVNNGYNNMGATDSFMVNIAIF